MRIKRCRKLVFVSVLATGVSVSGMAIAGKASVLDATVIANANGTYSISASVFHKDEGWTHYADRFEVLTMEGEVIATRVLYQPHVNEQPFTRSISNVQVPIGETEAIIRAHDNVHGDGERTFTVKLPPRK